jgi:hypothetical protein
MVASFRWRWQVVFGWWKVASHRIWWLVTLLWWSICGRHVIGRMGRLWCAFVHCFLRELDWWQIGLFRWVIGLGQCRGCIAFFWREV